jgi:prepilin-type N-terminal cleavage/methylation domain-containing protein/prepilin-type processing-associated H-X9-DG protein
MTSRKRAGFTLIELLVVVAIIAVLIAILLPSLGRAKANAVRVKCAAVLKQWGMVVTMYQQENNGLFGVQWGKDAAGNNHVWTSQSTGSVTEIYDAEWPGAAGFKYSAGLHSCPGDPAYGHILNDGGSVSNAFRPPVDYAMVRYIPLVSGKTMWSINQFNHPASTLLICDAPPTLSGPFAISKMSDLDGPGPELFKDSLQNRHLGIGNAAFLDGHVEQHNYQDFQNNIPSSWGSGYSLLPNESNRVWTSIAN